MCPRWVSISLSQILMSFYFLCYEFNHVAVCYVWQFVFKVCVWGVLPLFLHCICSVEFLSTRLGSPPYGSFQTIKQCYNIYITIARKEKKKLFSVVKSSQLSDVFHNVIHLVNMSVVNMTNGLPDLKASQIQLQDIKSYI